MKPILAMIIPVDTGAHPDQGLPGSQPHPDQGLPGQLPHPSHPIFYPLPPGAPVHPDQGLPGDQPHPDQGLPGDQPHPDQGLPGSQPHPEHPIVLPPDAGGGWEPVYIWGPSDGRPTPPIALPPEGSQPQGKVEWKAVWTPTTGWITFGIVVPEGAHPTPSKKK